MKTNHFSIDFHSKEAQSGMLLIASALVAIIFANTFLNQYYQLFLSTKIAIHVNDFVLAKPLLLWINDGLMAIFFLLIGLELKRELLEGELSNIQAFKLPAIGAIGGMAVPALIYALLNSHDPVSLRGWAIPAATDIAFALGILALLGKRVPITLKIFLTSLAIFDDVGAIIIIAFFYSSKISLLALLFASGCTLILYLLNRFKVSSLSPYLLIGAIMWLATLKSGVHATLAGILLAIMIPNQDREKRYSPLKDLERDLHNVVAFIILPIFAFANAGLPLIYMTFDQIVHNVPLGIILGLFVGKPLGIYGLCWISLKLGLVKLPRGVNKFMLLGVSLLCGVGFTMSLFIGSLAFENMVDVGMTFDYRLGIIVGSLLSGITGFYVLKLAIMKIKDKPNKFYILRIPKRIPKLPKLPKLPKR